MIDVAVAMGLALAGGALLTLGSKRGPSADPSAYPVAGGRILLRARLAGGTSRKRAAASRRDLLVRQVRDLLLDDGPICEVRLHRNRRSRGFLPSLIQGWEEPLVRPLSSALVATSLMSMAFVGLEARSAGGAEATPFPEAAPLAADPTGESGLGFDEPGRWERELLLADIGVPAPHIFRKRVNDPGTGGQGGTTWGGGGGDPGTVIHGHANHALVPHTNVVFVPHTNVAPPGYPPAPFAG